jgi:hypothetical protein
MELTEIPIWQWILTVWSSMWILILTRTWTRVKEMLQMMHPRLSITQSPILHFLIYALCVNLILPIIGFSIILNNIKRDQWVKSYVKQLGTKKK